MYCMIYFMRWTDIVSEDDKVSSILDIIIQTTMKISSSLFFSVYFREEMNNYLKSDPEWMTASVFCECLSQIVRQIPTVFSRKIVHENL